MNSRALVRHASALEPSQAWDDALAELALALGSIEPTILRADWIVNVESMTWSSFNELIDHTRRGYFRSGLALPDFSLAFTEQELNSNLMINGGKDHLGGFQAEHSEVYCRTRFGKNFPSLQPSSPIVVFDTLGAFVSNELEKPLAIDQSGHRLASPIDPELIAALNRNACNRLARQVQPNGQFISGTFPADDRVIASYSAQRHFVALNAMLEVFSREQSDELQQSIVRALDYGINSFIRWRPLEDGSQAAHVEEPRNVKLELNGIALAALSKFTELTKSNKYMPLMDALARDIVSKRDFDGESIFGLLKLYSITRDEKLLETAEEAARRMISTARWKKHEPPLSIAINELTKHQPRAEYFELGINNFADQLSFIRDRETQMPTLLELIAAADEMLERMKKIPESSHLLERIDLDEFYYAMESRAKKILDGYFYPEQAMYFARPRSIVGSFFMRQNNFRVRIDDIAHYVMGLEAYQKYLGHRKVESKPSEEFLPIRKSLKSVEPKDVVDEPKKISGEAEIFYAGDFVIARRMHWRAREVKPIGDIEAMRRADLRIVNLECVVATAGEQGVDKGEGGPYYYHARPEMLNVVTDANVDVVLTANNHIGDYGSAAVLEQKKYLDEAGLIHVGSGANVEEAAAPIFVKVNDLIIAIFSVETVTKQFAAMDDKPGAWYLPLNETELWRSIFSEKIAAARRHADLVIVAPHWYGADHKPTDQIGTIGRTLIDCGADVVLGCHSHNIQGVENYNGRPIVYDAGNFLFEATGREKDTGCFSLSIDRSGVKRIEFTPLKNGYGYVVPATRSRDRINEWFAGMCRELGTDASIKDGTVEIKFDPAPRGAVERASADEAPKIFEPPLARYHIEPLSEPRPEWIVDEVPEAAIGTDASIKDGTVEIKFDPAPRGAVERASADEAPKIFEPPLARYHIEPLSEPRPEWIVDEVPEAAIISPRYFGPLKMVGYRIPRECRTLTDRRMLYVETYWKIDRPVSSDCRLEILAKPIRECRVQTFGVAMDHEFCDWMWPVERWKPGVIYREKFGLRPPYFNRLFNVDLRVEIRVRIDGKNWGPFIDPQPVKIDIPFLAHYNYDYPDEIYRSKLGQCWNAKQLAAVTGGKWLVEPPEGWFVQSLLRTPENHVQVKKPTLFVANSHAQHAKHAGGNPNASKWDSHAVINKCLDTTVGAMISHSVEGLPPDYPLLLVDDTVKASMELGFAARQRFQGRTVAVTGSSGKTTTCYMLQHVLGHDHEIAATYGSVNTRVMVPYVFASVRQDTAFAIIEIAVSALSSPRGSITYEIKPNIAVVTSLTSAHAEEYKTIENLAKFKSAIMCGMEPGGYAILNRDMPCWEIFEKRANDQKLDIISFGTHPESTIRMERLMNGGTFTVEGKEYRLACPGPNEQLYDALAVIGVAMASGLPIEDTLELLKTFQTVEGRGNLVDANFNGKRLRLINSSFNANPLSMHGALAYLKALESQAEKRVAILGDMLELGNETIELHRGVAEQLLETAPDRVLFVGELMKHLYDDVKGEYNCAWFPTYKEAIEGIDEWLKDGDTVLLKSSHGTHLDNVVSHLSTTTKRTEEITLHVPKARFDAKEFLPEGITPEMNGRMPLERMQKIYCGGMLYVDAARAWNAMVAAAERDGVFLSANIPVKCYRSIETQTRIFKSSFTPLERLDQLRGDAIRVKYEGRVWQLNEGKRFAAVPGTSSHGFGLAVDVQNIHIAATKQWLEANANDFGFKQEFDFESWHYTYVRSREGVSDRVLELERREPPKTWTADEIADQISCQWIVEPPEDWKCFGLLCKRPLRVGMLTAVDQGDGVGFNLNLINLIDGQCAGFICTDPEPLLKYKKPILVVQDLADAVDSLKGVFE